MNLVVLHPATFGPSLMCASLLNGTDGLKSKEIWDNSCIKYKIT